MYVLMFYVTGGDDGRYTFVNSSDLRPYKEKSGAQFLMQAMHTTLTHHYSDTLNFLLLSNSTTDTIVHVREGREGRVGGLEFCVCVCEGVTRTSVLSLCLFLLYVCV